MRCLMMKVLLTVFFVMLLSVAVQVPVERIARVTGLDMRSVNTSLASGPAAYDMKFSTFLGGSNDEYCGSIIVDNSGKVYVTGGTKSPDFPTLYGGYDTVFKGGGTVEGFDAFVSKLNSDGTVLIQSTFIGGTGDDWGFNIAYSTDNHLYLCGRTASPDFPTTPGAFDTSFNGNEDVFICKLSDDCSSLVNSTYLGGTDFEDAEDMVLDKTGFICLAGRTRSADFPVTSGAFDPTFNDYNDVFVCKLASDLSGFLFSTYLGGNSADWGTGVATDNGGNIYVTGWTTSLDFPTTPTAYDTRFNGGNQDAFLSKLNPDGSVLMFSTYLGGTGLYGDDAADVTVDAHGNAYVTGTTWSPDFPTTTGAFDTIHNYMYDVFVTKFVPSGTGLVYSTFLGGTEMEGGTSIFVDDDGNAYVTGWTRSTEFPTTTDAYDTTFNGDQDIFVTKLDPAGASVMYSGYLGGTATDSVQSITFRNGYVSITGETSSPDFPVTAGAFSPVYHGANDAFISKLVVGPTPPATATPTVTPTPTMGSSVPLDGAVPLCLILMILSAIPVMNMKDSLLETFHLK